MGEEFRILDDQGTTIRTILKLDGFTIEQFGFSSCGQWIAAAGGWMVRLWKGTSIEHNWTCVAIVEGFFCDVSEIAWRPNTTEFATASFDGSFRAWNIAEESGEMSVQLIWSYGGSALTAQGAAVVGVEGLSAVNQKLLEQRGAILESSPADDTA
ncbi:hypothetical protein BGW39_000351 [Mortierella sp. 14UC]|nr:hypothetical protein BGW39_000351 [Mortierella sp. 14UC]